MFGNLPKEEGRKQRSQEDLSPAEKLGDEMWIKLVARLFGVAILIDREFI